MSLAAWLAVAIAALGALLAGAGWSLSSPVGSSPDDDYHQVSIWCAASQKGEDCKRSGTSEEGGPIVTVPALLAGGACYAGNSELSGDCQEDVVRLGMIQSDRVNTVDYPGGYYRVMNLFVTDNVERSVAAMRIFNVFLAVVLFTVLAVAGTPATRRLQLYTMTAVMVPVGWFFVASVNPSGWAVTGVTAFGFGLHSAFLVRRRASLVTNAVAAGAGALMAMNARGDAAIYVTIVAVAVSVLHWRTLLRRKKLVLLPAAFAVLGAWMGLSAAQVAGIASSPPLVERTGTEVSLQMVLNMPLLFSGLFGYGWGLGWLDTYVPPLTAFSVVLVIGFLCLTGARRASRSKLLALAVVGGALVCIPALTMYRSRLIVGEGIQPRYLLPLVPVFLLLLMTGRRRGHGVRLAAGQAWLVWALLTLANSAALHTNIRRYVTGTDGPTVLGDPEWWWGTGAPSPTVTWLVASVGFAAFAAGVILVSHGRRSMSGAGGSAPIQERRSQDV